MTALPLLAVGPVMTFVAVLFFLCSIVLILVVLIQKGRGGGLSGALGGGMASGILGSKTGDFLTWATIVVAGVFLFVAILLAKFYKPSVGEFGKTATSQQTTSNTPSERTLPAGSTSAPTTSTTPAVPNSEQPSTPGRQPANDSNARTPGR